MFIHPLRALIHTASGSRSLKWVLFVTLFMATLSLSQPGFGDDSPEDITYADVFIPTGPILTVSGNKIDQPVLHPAIPLLDEQKRHVLDSGQPYSPKTSCGESGCHDYDTISHGQHFEMGRDEAKDAYGLGRGGWSQVSSPGYFGGISCMGAQMLARKNGKAGFSGDFGAAGQIQACGQCHTGGGWAEKDRSGVPYNQKKASGILAGDGDYFNRGEPGTPVNIVRGGWKQTGFPLANSPIISRWNWKQSGVLENDCMMCHGDYSRLTLFSSSSVNTNLLPKEYDTGFDIKETPALPYKAWWNLRNEQLIANGLFREAPTALLEFLNIRPDTPSGQNLVSFVRDSNSLTPTRDKSGKPLLQWNAAAFDDNRKVTMPMRRFPANDNCWQCHGNAIEQDRRGFWGFGEAARGRVQATAYKADVHKGRLFTENNNESRQIDNCAACHTQGLYYDPSFANVALNADHNFPKGHSDVDVRRDLDNRPSAKSCEYCHDQALYKIIPSGHPDLTNAHRELWKASGFMDGYPRDTLTRITQTHLDVVACQTCHINGLKDFKGKPIDLFYRYRRAEDGKLKIMPTVDRYQFRYFWKDKNSGRVLRQGELFSVYQPKKDASGTVVAGILTDPITQTRYELPGSYWMPFTSDYPNFVSGSVYDTTLALKRNYDALLRAQGVKTPDIQLVWMQSNAYVVSHNTRASVDSLPCQDCHTRKQSGSFSALVSYTGILGEGNVKVLSAYGDSRLIEEGIVSLNEPYLHVDTKNRIVTNASDLLFATKQDPSLTALKAESATQADGEWSQVAIEDLWHRLRMVDTVIRNSLYKALGTSEVLVYSRETGGMGLRELALALPASDISLAIMPRYRVESSVTEMSEEDTKALADSGLGIAASDRFSLKMRGLDGKLATSFFGQSVWVKLPYRGQQTDVKKMRVAMRVKGVWQKSGIPVLWVHVTTDNGGQRILPGDSLYEQEAGYVWFKVDQPFTDLSVTEQP
ncbi:MAG: cytochrome C [Methylococcaceae bacterium]